MKEKDEEENMEEDTSELNIEELTDIQGGIEDDDKTITPTCGLGCFQGSGSPGKDYEIDE
ncbi:hypothetical protein [Proteiniphilum sp.]|uniref:hypothetical protein n=1 Tax=Proteiniphilum sp. TaxID=1926877 RepID=UPI003318FF93